MWLLIRNQDGKFWIPRRQATKKVLPNCLDGSAVGHVSSGEVYEQSMIREVAEELNIDISGMFFYLLVKRQHPGYTGPIYKHRKYVLSWFYYT